MRRLLPFLVLLTGCATVFGPPPGPPRGHPHLCGECSIPCPHQERVCEPEGAVAAAPAPAPAPRAPAAAVVFEPAAGDYTGSQMVVLSSPTPGAVIHYTTDGSEPTAESPIYTGPIRVDGPMTVKAIAVAPDMPASAVSSAAYTVAPPPPPPPARVAITEKKLELKDKVFFDTGKTTIKPESFSLLDEVASVMKAHPEVKKVVVEGYTDNRGSKKVNMKLSKGRAEAVRTYLVDKGVEADRLEAKGFGPTHPIADNATAKGREENRRVEFTIPKS
jgi:outer membrane protein OmpA-like peptidoglycan-associated protein